MNKTLNLTAPSCSDEHDSSALSTDAALQRILEAIRPPEDAGTERVDLLVALDRVLGEDVRATLDVPGHDNSAMDGYALNAADLPETGTRSLSIAGSALAGHPFLGACRRGECVRIMTGAVMPEGTDTVVPQEHVELPEESSLRIDGRTRPGDNVRRAGEDIRRGQTVLMAGRRLRAADIGLLASLGISQVCVRPRLRVALISTGDELRTPSERLHPGEIYDSNRYTLSAMLTHEHCEITQLGVVRDEPDALRAALRAAAGNHDMVVTSGGVSVGDADYVRDILEELGDVAFWKVAMKPGRPLTFGHIGKAVFFGLPGNPVAVMVTFSQFVKPALRRLSGETFEPPLTLQAVSTSTFNKRAGRTEYQRGILSQQADGSLTVRKTGQQGSGVLTSMSSGNCFIVLPAEQTLVEPGTVVTVQPFAGWL